MLDFTIIPRQFHLLIAPLLSFLPQAVIWHRSDYRAHKFKTQPHLLLTIFAHLTKAESANALVEELNDFSQPSQATNLRQLIGFNQSEWGESVTLNQSSFSRANASRSYRVWRYSFHRLLDRANKLCRPNDLAGLGRIMAVDGTLFDCLPRMAWAVYRSTTNKVKGHFFVDLNGLPDKLVLTSGKGSEREVLATHYRKGVTYLFDRGYLDYELFSHLTKEKVWFVTRPLKSLVIEVLEERAVEPAQRRQGLLYDQRVRLGQGTNTVELRRVIYLDSRGEKWAYLTNRFDLEPMLVVELYQRRWEVELFFWWIKRHLQLKHWYSENENGVLIQLYAGLISFILLKIYAATTSKGQLEKLRIGFLRQIRRHLFDLVALSEIEAYLVSLPDDSLPLLL